MEKFSEILIKPKG